MKTQAQANRAYDILAARMCHDRDSVNELAVALDVLGWVLELDYGVVKAFDTILEHSVTRLAGIGYTEEKVVAAGVETIRTVRELHAEDRT